METSDENIKTLSSYLLQTLSPDVAVRKPAENFLTSVENSAGFSRVMICVILNSATPFDVKVAGAVTLKNFIKRNWMATIGNARCISDADRAYIKQEILQLMIATAPAVKRQVAEALAVIGASDFPHEWPELITKLVSYFESGDFDIIRSVLETAHSLFKHYRSETRSNKLWEEIKYVLDSFASPLTVLHQMTVNYVTNALTGTSAMPATTHLIAAVECLVLMAKIFYSLNIQDLPEFFEDNMNGWMTNFLNLLKADARAVSASKEDVVNALCKLKSHICENIGLYAQRYEEEFAPYLPAFVEVVWTMLVETGREKEYDLLVANGIAFLSSVCERDQYKNLFASTETLSNICQHIIVPNLELRDCDIELCEISPEEYVQNEIEGFDANTRRGSAIEFVKVLCKMFEKPVLDIFSSNINQLFADYAANPEQNWPRKDLAINLVIALISRGKTLKYGATKTTDLIDVPKFFVEQVKSDLVSDQNYLPMLKMDSLKFVVTFRHQLPKHELLVCFPLFVQLLNSSSVGVRMYAAHVLERLLIIKDAKSNALVFFDRAEVLPMMQQTLKYLFWGLDQHDSAENMFLMKCVMRCLLVCSDDVVPYANVVLSRLVQKLLVVAKNPSRPHFNHYLLESLCVLIRDVSKKDAKEQIPAVEETLFPIFQEILRADVAEFIPYVFQILALTLDMRPVGYGIPEPFAKLFSLLLVPSLWERKGNVPALVRLLKSYMKVGSEQISSEQDLSAILGIFQKLVASSQTDHDAFFLLDGIIEYYSWQKFEPFVKGTLVLLFNRLQNSRTAKFVKNFIVFLCLFCIKFGGAKLVAAVDGIQCGIFGMLLEKVILVDIGKVSDPVEKKICCVGIAKLLTENLEQLIAGQYKMYWLLLLESETNLFVSQNVKDYEYEEIPDNFDFDAAYCKLAYAAAENPDPTHVDDIKSFLLSSLNEFNASHPGFLSSALTAVREDTKASLMQFLNAVGFKAF